MITGVDAEAVKEVLQTDFGATNAVIENATFH